MALAVGERDLARLGIDRGDVAVQPEVDAGLGIETVRTQRHPVLRRAAGEIILGQVRPIDRRLRYRCSASRCCREIPAAAAFRPRQSPPRRRRRSRSCPARSAGALAARLRLLALSPDEDAASSPARLARPKAGSAPVHASPRRCADRSRHGARGSGCRRRRRSPRPAARDNGCNAHRSRKSRSRIAPAGLPDRRHGRARSRP